MKCAVAFVVLMLVVLMVDSGECGCKRRRNPCIRRRCKTRRDPVPAIAIHFSPQQYQTYNQDQQGGNQYGGNGGQLYNQNQQGGNQYGGNGSQSYKQNQQGGNQYGGNGAQLYNQNQQGGSQYGARYKG